MSKLVERTARHEEFRARPYRDSKGIWTVGYGWNLEANTITEPEARLRLEKDLKSAEEGIRRHLDWFQDLHETRREVFIEMAFQLGVRGFLRFRRTLRYAAIGEHAKAADEMLDSVWARTDSPGRAKELSDLYRSAA